MANMIRRILIVGSKLGFTGICLWYVFRQFSVEALSREAASVNQVWLVLATFFAMAQGPLVGVRWAWINDAFEPLPQAPLSSMIVITLIANFFSQIVPNVVSDALRIWLLSRIRPGWARGIISVAIDRGVGVGVLLIIGLVALTKGSAFTALSGYRSIVILTFGALLVVGAALLVCAPVYAPVFACYRSTKWIGEFVLASWQVLIKSPKSVWIFGIAFAVHLLSIADIWCVGKAFSMGLSLVDAAVLFTLMVAIALIPITINGWGLREVAVTAFLGAYGVPLQRALLFSVCFGMTLAAAALPGAIAILVYSPMKVRRGDPGT
jgi:glycosyltransferase 2 family protein